jgi:hypothetical protein
VGRASWSGAVAARPPVVIARPPLAVVRPPCRVGPTEPHRVKHRVKSWSGPVQVAWVRTVGFAPHRDYAKIEPIFGTTDTAQCDVEFRFGQDGNPMIIGDTSDIPPRLIPGGGGGVAD